MKRKNRIRIISVLLIVCLFCSYLPASAIAVGQEETPVAAPREITLSDVLAGVATIEDLYGKLDESVVPDAIGYDEAVKKQHVARLYEEEGNDLNKVIFLNADGSKTMYTFDHPVKYQTAAGEIQDISLEIADSLSSNAAFVSASADAVTTFSANLSDGISLSGNGVNIDLVPLLPTTSSGNNMAQTGSMGATSGNLTLHTAIRLDEKTVSYYYDDKTTIEYSLTYTGFKEDIVVSEYTGQTEYSFLLNTGGYALEEINGSYFLVDDAGNIKATIGDIIIFTADERNNALGQIVPTTIREKEQYLLTIVIDEDYLADENTAYPIRIDPTVEITYAEDGAGKIEDATVYTDDTTNPYLYSIFVGNKQNGGIARILMKFPGLDLSNLGENVYIESASVSLRDLLCEATPLAVSCYVYCGGIWNEEDGVTWDETIEKYDEYLSTYLDTQTISYTNGAALSNPHRYHFDITEAARGWMDGNYNYNKGLIFKASDSVENGTTYNWKTLSSYNRGSYEPRLTITYSPDVWQLVNNDDYFINNKETGKYLRYLAGNIDGASGLLKNLIAPSIKWTVQKSSSGDGYFIRSMIGSSNYLAVPTNPADTSISSVEISDEAIPDRCLWDITLAAGGGCLIKSRYNNKYLYSDGENIYTVASVGEPLTSQYYSAVWRIPSASTYGNRPQENERIEMSAQTTILPLIIEDGQSAGVSVQLYYPNELWVNASDFTYEFLYPGRVSENRGVITGEATGVTTAIATHKVTTQQVIFAVVVGAQPTYTINHYVDQGFVARHGSASYVAEYDAAVQEIFSQIFGIDATSSIVTVTSLADNCKTMQFGSVATDNLDETCPHSFEHLNVDVLNSSIGWGHDLLTRVLWTGHELESLESLDFDYNGISYNSTHTVIIVPLETTSKSIYVLLHELSHQLGAPDHYCYKDYDQNNKCSNKNCDICVYNLPAVRECLMNSREKDVTKNLDALYCDSCLRIINGHLRDHHQEE